MLDMITIRLLDHVLLTAARDQRARRSTGAGSGSRCRWSMAEGMALSRPGRGRRQVETVWTGMGFGQIAILRVWPLGQLGIARVDLDYAPSQPPPLVTALRRGDECDVTAVVSGYELTAEGTFVRYGILRDRGQRQQLGGADGQHGAAASLLVPPRPGGTRHAATVPERCDFDTGVRHRAWSWSPGRPSP
jgi:hypothetical protein